MVESAIEMHGVTSAEGGRIAVYVQPVPEPAGVPVLLVHGFGSNARANWESSGWFRQLARTGIPAVALDLRGHGRSDRPRQPQHYSLDVMVGDLFSVLGKMPEWFGPVPVLDLAGYSLGGRLVTELAARLASSPAAGVRARRMVLGGQDGRPMLNGVDIDEMAQHIRVGPAPRMMTRPSSPAARLSAIAHAVPGNNPEALLALISGLLADGGVCEPAPLPQLPTLVVAGGDDPVAPRALEWASAMPDARTLIVPGRNHINVVTSRDFRTAAINFLGSPTP